MPHDPNPGCGDIAFACQTVEDTCAVDADCPSDEPYCSMGGSDHRRCVEAGCAIGRPFLVDGVERTAAAVASRDWRGPTRASLAGLTPALAAELAAHWTRAGLMEHASIAAFARFALQLLALGAPPELIERAERALGDERRHAAACFGLASRYAGRAIGPGPLAIDGALAAADARDILRLTVREGCIGETVASIEAAEAAAHAVDPEVRATLEGIAADEARHADLAWRFVRWLLARDPSLGEVLRVELAVAEREGRPDARDGDHLLAHGVLGEGLRAVIRRQALREVVVPCARGLLEREEPAAPHAFLR
jgi:hypothetical protein